MADFAKFAEPFSWQCKLIHLIRSTYIIMQMLALDNQPIKITTQFSGSDVTGQHEHPVDSDITEEVKLTRSNHLKFRVTL